MNNPKIHILYEFKEGPFGGANQFLKALKNAFINHGFYTKKAKSADIILMNAYPANNEHYFLKALKLKQNGAKIVYRLDGLFYMNRLDEKHKKLDEVCKKFINQYCDGVIYQTNWIKEIQEGFGIKKDLPKKNDIKRP